MPTVSGVEDVQAPVAAPPPPTSEAPSVTNGSAVSATGKKDEDLNDAIIVTRRRPSPADPAEQINAVSYAAVQSVDKAVIGPVARGYKSVFPKPVQDGLHNVLNNLDEPIVFANFLLQLKPGKAAETLARFAVNSTFGVAGLFDVAKRKPINLPRRSNGLADTLGYYGVGPGPYLFLPIIGSTSLRDLIARPFDLAVLPVIAPKPFAKPYVGLTKGVLNALDDRAQNDELLADLSKAEDPYVAQREEYLARRKAEIEVLQGKRKSIYDPPYYQVPAPAGTKVLSPAPLPANPPASSVPESTAEGTPAPQSAPTEAR